MNNIIRQSACCRRLGTALCSLAMLHFASPVSQAGSGPVRLVERDSVTYLAEGDTLTYVVIEGDILIPIDAYEGSVASVYASNLWGDGSIRYEFNAAVPEAKQAVMLNAFAILEGLANVEFVEGIPDLGWGVRIYSTDSSDCPGCECKDSATVGAYPEFIARVHICRWYCDNDRDGTGGEECMRVILHELAHTLGLWHEQSRPDRDLHVRINWDNIEEGREHNFDRHDEASMYGPYDFESLMHYGECSWRKAACSACPDSTSCADGGRTIIALPGYERFQSVIGRAIDLSYLDRLILSFLYPEDDWRFVDDGECGDGTFLFPTCHVHVGYSLTPDNGTLWIQPGSYSAPGTYSRPMTIRAPLGDVTLGN